MAREHGSRVIGMSGKSGGDLHTAVDLSLVVPSDVTARIQEMHIVIGHLLCALIEHHLRSIEPCYVGARCVFRS